MKSRKMTGVVFFVAIAFLLGGCAIPTKELSPFSGQAMDAAKWQPKADNLLFVLDSSSSMAEGYNDVEKFAIAKGVLANFNQTMPDLAIQTGLRTFGHAPKVSAKSTVLTYGWSAYARQDLAAAIEKTGPAGGPSPMDKSLAAVGEDLAKADGKTALVIVSDGKDMGKTPLAVAKALKEKYGDRLGIYTVLVGNDEAGRALLEGLSKATGCGSMVAADQLTTPAQMADFVETVLLEPAPPAPVPVAPAPAPKVEKPKKASWVFRDIKFEFDKATLMPASYPILDGIYEALRDNPEIAVEIQGHTCAIGTDQYNQGLSERRAQTVMKYLQGKGIAASRMTAKGYGEAQPMDSNKTKEGRANNRRVELKPIQ